MAKLRRLQFGRKSEKLDCDIEQLELRLDELEATQAEKMAGSQTPAVVVPNAKCSKTRAASPGGASAARNAEVSAEADRLPGLRRRVEASGRRRLGNAGVRTGAVQSDPADLTETGVRVL